MAMGLCAATVSLWACGVNVHSSVVRGIGYVRLDEAVKRDPLDSGSRSSTTPWPQ